MTDETDLKATRKTLLHDLRRFLPEANILHKAEALRPYECDGLPAYRQPPLLTVLPDAVAQVRDVMRLCHRLRVPVVARGAATGLSGGALPLADGVLLSLAKLKEIIRIDPVTRTARARVRVINSAPAVTAR